MNKYLMLIISFCFGITASAQQNQNYTYKLDSVRYGNDGTVFLQYDDRLNCTEIKLVLNYVSPSVVSSVKSSFYDDENRVIKTDYSYDQGIGRDIHEYTYDDNGMMTEDVFYSYYYSDIISIYKYTYEYDENLHKTTAKGYLFDNNTWKEQYRINYEYENDLLISSAKYIDNNYTPYEINNFTYNDQGLCIEILKTRGYFNYEIERTLYIYDELGNRTSITVFSKEHIEDEEWTVSSKSEFTYDENNNCIVSDFERFEIEYNYQYDHIHIQYNHTYDLSYSINETAGFMDFWHQGINFNFTPKNIVTSYSSIDLLDGTTTGPTTFHYSNCTGIEEVEKYSLQIWPNPVSETLYMDRDGFVEIYTMDGRLMLSTKTSGSINVSMLQQGCYLLKFFSENGNQIIQKIIIS